MKKAKHAHKYILLTFILLLSNSIFSQQIPIDNYIIIDPLLQDEQTKSLSSKHFQNEEYQGEEFENTWWFLHNSTEVLYFHIIQSVNTEEITDPIEELSIAGFIRFAEQRYKETDSLKNLLYWNRGYLSDFIFNNIYLKILNTETNKVEYFKVNFSYAERMY